MSDPNMANDEQVQVATDKQIEVYRAHLFSCEPDQCAFGDRPRCDIDAAALIARIEADARRIAELTKQLAVHKGLS